MKTLMASAPVLSPKTVDQLRNIGVDTDNPDLTTNAAILSATIMQKAYSGDPVFIKMAFEMSGTPVDIKGVTDLERLKLEREKLKLLQKGEIHAGADVPTIVINQITADNQQTDE